MRGYYLHLRLGLLLSLATKDSRRLNVLSLGEEFSAPARVMRECMELARGAVVHTERAGLGGSQGAGLLNAGELHLARDGVMLVNNITVCKKATKVRYSTEKSSI